MLALRARTLAIPRARTSSRIVLAARIRYYSVVVDAPRPRKTKVWDSVDEAIKDVKSGDIILSGGTQRVFRKQKCTHLTLTSPSPRAVLLSRVWTVRHPRDTHYCAHAET